MARAAQSGTQGVGLRLGTNAFLPGGPSTAHVCVCVCVCVCVLCCVCVCLKASGLCHEACPGRRVGLTLVCRRGRAGALCPGAPPPRCCPEGLPRRCGEVACGAVRRDAHSAPKRNDRRKAGTRQRGLCGLWKGRFGAWVCSLAKHADQAKDAVCGGETGRGETRLSTLYGDKRYDSFTYYASSLY